jgi:CheY-like chemotaxis protein
MQAMAELQAKILVVDDEVKNVKLMEALLVPRGYTVVKAYNGEEALQLVHGQRLNLILLDVMMPHMEGFEVCKRLYIVPIRPPEGCTTPRRLQALTPLPATRPTAVKKWPVP